MADSVKVTKRQSLEAIAEIVKVSGAEDTNELVAVIEKIIEQDANRAAKAKERAAAKRAEGDELKAKIKSLLTEDYQSADQIVEAINDPEVTKAKVIARLRQIIADGEAEKAEVKIGDNKRMAYKAI